MKAAVYVHKTRNADTPPQLIAIAEGLKRCGVTVSDFMGVPDSDADFCVVWGMRRALRCQASGFKGPILIAERGWIDRFNYTSLGWDGINGRARFGAVHDEDRFNRLFGHNLKPWRKQGGYALIMGQVLGDASLFEVDIIEWYKKTAVALWKAGWDIKFRPHPVSEQRGHARPRVPFSQTFEGTMEEALDGAGLVVAYNSNSLVDAILAGIPVCAGDRGSMVYDLASKDFSIIYPERERRLNEIANYQWSLAEMSDGKAWEVVKSVM